MFVYKLSGFGFESSCRQARIVFDWKENTSVEEEEEEEEEEEGKVILDLLSDIYDFQEKKKAFLSSFSCFLLSKTEKVYWKATYIFIPCLYQ